MDHLTFSLVIFTAAELIAFNLVIFTLVCHTKNPEEYIAETPKNTILE